eukprot:NODE_30_length_37342_cov_0.449507.p5 type:complete len:584 gc:universal NODE_30_length_37342_cov_0.449507:31134-32885(+)
MIFKTFRLLTLIWFHYNRYLLKKDLIKPFSPDARYFKPNDNYGLLKKPIRHDKCIYPFDEFLTEFDRYNYALCLSRVNLLEENDAQSEEEALLFYKMHYGPVPHYFSRYYKFAKEKQCKINRFDQLYRQLKPFKNTKHRDYDQLLRTVSDFFNNTQLTSIEFVNGKTHVNVNSDRAGAYIPIFEKIQDLLPDMHFFINTHAQPIVMHNPSFKGSRTKFNQHKEGLGNVELTVESSDSSKKSIVKLSQVLKKTCAKDDYRSSLEEGYGLFINAPEEYQTFDLLPILSWGGYPGCTKDILIPSVYHYEYKLMTKHYRDLTEWDNKYDSILWRGTTSGSPFYYKENRYYMPSHVCVNNCVESQYKITKPLDYSTYVWFYGHRQRLVTYSNLYPEILDIDFVDGVEVAQEFTDEAFTFYKKAFRIHFTRFFDYKFILDIDGNGYSGRFLKLLRGNSLIFSAHYAIDWFSDMAIPFYHFIPIDIGFDFINHHTIPENIKTQMKARKTSTPKFDFEKKNIKDDFNTPIGYNDLAPKYLYYKNNQGLARKIAEQGSKFAAKYLREDDMDCFLLRVFIELFEILRENKPES